MSLVYRAAQFCRAILANPSEEDLKLAEAHLPPPLRLLFHQMGKPEQAHGVLVLRTILADGEQHPDLLTAALLHDVGKSRSPLRSWDRVGIVAGSTIAPRLVERWGVESRARWRHPFEVAAKHAEWGAEMIQQAGGTVLLTTLVRRHQDPPPLSCHTLSDQLLHKLQLADAMN